MLFKINLTQLDFQTIQKAKYTIESSIIQVEDKIDEIYQDSKEYLEEKIIEKFPTFNSNQ